MAITGEFAWLVTSGLTVGDRDRVGTPYRVVVRSSDGTRVSIHDPLAASTPFGAFAPAEVIDASWTSTDRTDAPNFASLARDGEAIPRIPPCANLLQIHVPTATEQGTISALTAWIERVAAKVEAGTELSPAEEIWLEYGRMAVAADPFGATFSIMAGSEFDGQPPR